MKTKVEFSDLVNPTVDKVNHPNKKRHGDNWYGKDEWVSPKDLIQDEIEDAEIKVVHEADVIKYWWDMLVDLWVILFDMGYGFFD